MRALFDRVVCSISLLVVLGLSAAAVTAWGVVPVFAQDGAAVAPLDGDVVAEVALPALPVPAIPGLPVAPQEPTTLLTLATVPAAVIPSAEAVPPDQLQPPTLAEIPAEIEAQRAAWHTGTLAGLVALVMLLTRLTRLPLAGRLLDRLPPEWRWTVPGVLGVAGAVLAGLVAGQSWWLAAIDGVGVALAAIGAHHAVVRDLLGVQSPRSQGGTGQAGANG